MKITPPTTRDDDGDADHRFLPEREVRQDGSRPGRVPRRTCRGRTAAWPWLGLHVHDGVEGVDRLVTHRGDELGLEVGFGGGDRDIRDVGVARCGLE